MFLILFSFEKHIKVHKKQQMISNNNKTNDLTDKASNKQSKNDLITNRVFNSKIQSKSNSDLKNV